MIPSFTGLAINTKLVKVQFAVLFAGVNITFFSPTKLVRTSRNTTTILRLRRLLHHMKNYFISAFNNSVRECRYNSVDVMLLTYIYIYLNKFPLTWSCSGCKHTL